MNQKMHVYTSINKKLTIKILSKLPLWSPIAKNVVLLHDNVYGKVLHCLRPPFIIFTAYFFRTTFNMQWKTSSISFSWDNGNLYTWKENKKTRTTASSHFKDSCMKTNQIINSFIDVRSYIYNSFYLCLLISIYLYVSVYHFRSVVQFRPPGDLVPMIYG